MDYLALRKDLQSSTLTTSLKEATTTTRSTSRTFATADNVALPSPSSSSPPSRPLGLTYPSSPAKTFDVLPAREPLRASTTYDGDDRTKPSTSFVSPSSTGVRPKNGLYGAKARGDDGDSSSSSSSSSTSGQLRTSAKLGGGAAGPPTKPKPFPR